jgi:alkanesulfonate monooxygenase SsuD/methylene tetrahydromethanopterin reductase-like flavin-dependent oxidoreductase (luciferase family)
MFSLRLDMRAPASGAPAHELYQAALEMAAWSETRGAVSASVSEHHMAADGYLPSPVTMVAALAARTTKLRLSVAVLLFPLYDPIRLAEDMCVVDILSQGRTGFIGAIGYRPAEYEMCGIDYHRRGAIAEKNLGVFLPALTGKPFEYEGRRIHVTPPPFTPGGPTFMWAGGSVPAARRAGRFGLGFLGQKDYPELREAYEDEARKHGRELKPCILAQPKATQTVFVAEDVDKAWAELGPYIMEDVLSYAEWNKGNKDVPSLSFAQTAEELRAENRSHRILTVEQAIEFARMEKRLPLQPLIGGLPPKIAWRYLETVANKVVPALST